MQYINLRSDKDPDGILDIIAHGSHNTVEVIKRGIKIRLKARHLARLIQSNSQFIGQKIRLLSCNTGLGPNCLAQQLTDRLQVPVIAPDNYLWVTKNGFHFVAALDLSGNKTPNLAQLGNFKTFTSRRKHG